MYISCYFSDFLVGVNILGFLFLKRTHVIMSAEMILTPWKLISRWVWADGVLLALWSCHKSQISHQERIWFNVHQRKDGLHSIYWPWDVMVLMVISNLGVYPSTRQTERKWTSKWPLTMMCTIFTSVFSRTRSSAPVTICKSSQWRHLVVRIANNEHYFIFLFQYLFIFSFIFSFLWG